MIDLWIYAVRIVDSANVGALTVAFNHERLDNVVSDHFKVRMADPVTNGGFGTSEEVVENGDLMT